MPTSLPRISALVVAATVAATPLVASAQPERHPQPVAVDPPNLGISLPDSFSWNDLAPQQQAALITRRRAVDSIDANIRPQLEAAGVLDSMIIDYDDPFAVTYHVSDLSQVSDLAEQARQRPDLNIVEPKFTEDELAAQVRSLLPKYQEEFAAGIFTGLGVDIKAQRLVLSVDQAAVEAGFEVVDEVDADSDLAPLTVVVDDTPPDDQGPCTNRSNCTGTFENGMVIRHLITGASCGYGLSVEYSNGDEQFLTAGHCPASSPTSNSFYHPGYGSANSFQMLATLYKSRPCCTPVIDVARFQVPNHKATDNTYDSVDINWARNAGHNELVCISRARGDNVRCARVTESYTTWYSNTLGVFVEGTRAATYESMAGDSGSPIQVGTTAVGIHNASGGRFARVGDILDIWNLTFVD